MKELKRLDLVEFAAIARRRGREYKYAKLLLYCEACKNGLIQTGVTYPCVHCEGKGVKIVTLPVLLSQRLLPDDFEFLKMSIRLGERYG